MRKPLIRTKYELVYKSIDDATLWLSAHGLNIDRTRIGEYKRVFKKFLDKYNSGNFTVEEQKEFFSTYVNLVYETQELVYISNGLSKLINSDLDERLKKFIKGPVINTAENSDKSTNLGRNIAFELLIASKLSSSGFEIDLGTEADLSIIHNNIKIFIECKRPQYKHQINSNIKGAFRQLKKRYNEYDGQKNVLGLIALSVSKILNPDLDILVSSNSFLMHSYIEKILDNFHNDHKKKYLNPGDQRTIGMIVYFSTPVSIEEEGIVAHSHLIDFTNCCDIHSKEIEIVREIAEIVDKGSS
ncbi:MAG: hypothetical protein RDU59_07620 [Thermodesulfobacteriota bacterium]|nr:hypothetical protein [Thermodesulfobacteriota bacterium]